MTDILTDISTYDLRQHLPFPTLKYVKQETGIDMFYEAGDHDKALAYLRTYTKTAWQFLAASKTTNTKNKLEYLIATKEDYRIAFLNYVMTFITTIYGIGGLDFFSKELSADLTRTLPTLIRVAINGTLLDAERIVLNYEYRVGY